MLFGRTIGQSATLLYADLSSSDLSRGGERNIEEKELNFFSALVFYGHSGRNILKRVVTFADSRRNTQRWAKGPIDRSSNTDSIF